MHLDRLSRVDAYPWLSLERVTSEHRVVTPCSVLAVRSRNSDRHFFVEPATGSFADSTGYRIAELCDAAALNTKWQLQVLDVSSPVDVDDLTDTVDAALEVVSRYGPASLDLSSLPGEPVQVEHLAAVLRASSMWKDQVPGWQDSRDWAEVIAAESGLDPADVLYGMV